MTKYVHVTVFGTRLRSDHGALKYEGREDYSGWEYNVPEAKAPARIAAMKAAAVRKFGQPRCPDEEPIGAVV